MMRWGGDGSELAELVIETSAVLRDALRALDAGAEAIVFVLTRAEAVVVPEMMVLPMKETSWP